MENIRVYHTSNHKFDRFDLTKCSDRMIWFCTDFEATLSNTVGARLDPRKSTFIYECQIESSSVASEETFRKGDFPMVQHKYDAANVDEKYGMYVVMNPKCIRILNVFKKE